MNPISEKAVKTIVCEYINKEKKVEKIEVSSVEQKADVWIIKGTCPINLEGHPWAEKFEVVIDKKGKLKSSYFALL